MDLLFLCINVVTIVTAYFASASLILPYFVARKLKKEKTVEQLQEAILPLVEKMFTDKLKEIDIEAMTVQILESDDVAEVVKGIIDNHILPRISEFAKKSIAGHLGVDSRLVEKGEQAIVDWVSKQGGGQMGNILDDIAGDDFDLKKVILKIAGPYLQSWLQDMFSKKKPGFGGGRRYY